MEMQDIQGVRPVKLKIASVVKLLGKTVVGEIKSRQDLFIYLFSVEFKDTFNTKKVI